MGDYVVNVSCLFNPVYTNSCHNFLWAIGICIIIIIFIGYVFMTWSRQFDEEDKKDNQTYARNGDDKMAEICDICSSESDIEMIATLGMDLCCDCRRKVFKELEEEVKIMRKLRKK